MAVRGISAALAGVVVLGVGGRLVMLLSRLIHLDARGRFTDNGNRIGEFTAQGTIELVLFGGLLGGLMGGVVWLLVKEWIPERWAAVGTGAVAIGGFMLVEADNPDFVIVGDPALDLILLLGLVFLFGAVLFWVDPRVDARLPATSGKSSIAVYSLLAAFGAQFSIPALGTYFTEEFCFCERPPVWTGVFLVFAGAASAVWWVLDLRREPGPPPWLRMVGVVAVLSAVVTGAVHLTGQVTEIL